METTEEKNTEAFKLENHKGIENHKKAASHLEAAARCHLNAAKFHEEGNHDRADQNSLAAHGHLKLATEAQMEDIKHHALNKQFELK